MTTTLKTGQQVSPLCLHLGVKMKTRINQSETGKSLLITLIEGFSTYTVTVSMPYAVRFFAEGIAESLIQNNEVQSNLIKNGDQKTEIQEHFRKPLLLSVSEVNI